MAFGEAIRDLEAQDAALASMRTTGGTVLAAAAIGTGFLASSALDRVSGFPWEAWVGLAGLLLAVAGVLYIVRPIDWTTSASAAVILGPTWSHLSAEEIVETFVEKADGWSESNGRELVKVGHGLRLSIAGAVIAFVGWALLLAST